MMHDQMYPYQVVIPQLSWDNHNHRHELVNWCHEHLGPYGWGTDSTGYWDITTTPLGLDMVPVVHAQSEDLIMKVMLTWC